MIPIVLWGIVCLIRTGGEDIICCIINNSSVNSEAFTVRSPACPAHRPVRAAMHAQPSSRVLRCTVGFPNSIFVLVGLQSLNCAAIFNRAAFYLKANFWFTTPSTWTAVHSCKLC